MILSEKTALDEARKALIEDIRQRGSVYGRCVLLNKAAIIEHCVMRAREEYAADSATFIQNLTRQDAAILNIQRACEAAYGYGQHLIRREKLGIPQSARDVFAHLA